MATQSNIDNKLSITNPYLYSNVWGCKWSGDVTYAFGTGPSPTSTSAGISVSETGLPWTETEKTALRQVLQNYANVCNLKFTEVAFDNANLANLVPYKVTDVALGKETAGVCEVPDGNNRSINTNHGWFNTSLPASGVADWSNFQAGGSGFELIMHELGHGVGLAHPHDGGGGLQPKPYPGINPIEKDSADMGDNHLNQGIWSTMSYNDGWAKNADGSDTGVAKAADKSYGYQSTLMAFDVAALQFLYGANMQYHTGNDLYTLAQANSSWQCIWDAGGIDTISNESASIACTINLNQAPLTNSAHGGGYVSANQQIAGGFTIANGAAIENATGGNAADTLIGNALRNALKGNAGNDLLDGRTGIDTGLYSASRSNYSITREHNGNARVVDNIGTEGTDSLVSVERLHFTNINVALDIDKYENAGLTYRMYRAAFERAPDALGLANFINALDLGVAANNIATEFVNSTEFQNRYGVNLSNSDFVERLYENALNRPSDPVGKANWVAALDMGTQTRGDLLIGFSESDENYQATISLIGQGLEYQQLAA